MVFKNMAVSFVASLYLTFTYQCYKIGFEEAIRTQLKVSRSYYKQHGTQIIDNNTKGPISDLNSMSLCKSCFWPGQTDFTNHTNRFSNKIKRSHGLKRTKDTWVNVTPYSFQTYAEYDNYFDWKGSKVLTQEMTCPVKHACYIALVYNQNLTHKVNFESFNSTFIPERVIKKAWQLRFDKHSNPIIFHIFRGPSRRVLWWNPVDYASLEMRYYHTWTRTEKLTNVIPSKLKWPLTVPIKKSTHVHLPGGIWGYEIRS